LFARERRLERDGRPVKIGSRALEILIALVQRPGEVVSKDDLVSQVWPDTVVEDSALRVHVSGLRKLLGDGQDGARYITNVTGRGYCFVGQVTPVEPVVRATREVHRSPDLPGLPGRIVGRDSATREVVAQLLETRFVTVVGPGGMGKTTVALAVAHSLLEEFRGEVRFVGLDSLTLARQTAAGVASVLGLSFDTDEAARELIAYLRDRRALLVLDSCEHVVDAIAPLAERIHRESEGVHILATSREALRVEGERAYQLPSLETPAEGAALNADEALRFPAVQLFVERAVAGGALPSLSDVDAPMVAEICRRLDGIALAIEFAAARVLAFGVRGTASLLQKRFKLLWNGRRTALPRHQTLGALLDWSYNLLNPDERRVLRSLSLFVGPFGLDAAVAVAGVGSPNDGYAIEIVGGLVEKSLVSVEIGGEPRRYRLLDTTRDYAETKLDEVNERDEVARRHATLICAELERANACSGPPTVPELVERLGNVRSALAWSFSPAGDAKLGVALAAASIPMFFQLSLQREHATASAPLFLQPSLLRECAHWLEAAIAAVDERETRVGVQLQVAMGVALMFTRGDTPEVRAALTRGVSLAEANDDMDEQIRMLCALHLLQTRADDQGEALTVAWRAADVAARSAEPFARSLTDWMVGTTAHLLGDQLEAERRCKSVLAPTPADSPLLAKLQFGFDHRVRALAILGRATWLLGRADEALEIAAKTVHEAADTGHPATIAISLVYASSVYLWCGDHDTTEELIDRLIACSQTHSLGPFHRSGLGLRGELLVKRGDTGGIELLRKAIGPLQAEGHALLSSVLATALAEGLAGEGNLSEALATIDGAIASTARNGGAFDVPEMLRVKGRILAMDPRSDASLADRCLLHALDSARRQHASAWELRIATTIARIWASQQRSSEGRDLLSRTYARFTQGLETADAVAAKQLLSEL
jgi:predicted ATPase/DNA-binding winged helix-turn-helix (wHTH) protein